MRQARENLERVRQLADAGAASRKQVEQAAAELREVEDDALIAGALDTRVALEDLTEEQSTEATTAARRRLERQRERLAEHAQLVGQGVAPRTSLLPFEEEIDGARRLLEAMERRARSLGEIAAMIRAEQEVGDRQPDQPSIADGAIARITRFAGENKFGNDEFKNVVLEFERKFDHKLPVSARGETALHRSMGFDHRGRVDVALNPDGVEGRWLMRHLEQQKIPFFAFRTLVSGQATAPHIHIGPPSMRIRATD
jgi:GNAT superfamily N-acetyltransferase